MNPGQTVTVTIKMDKTGVFPWYCTVFCSALHQEMQGYFVVYPPDQFPAFPAEQYPGDH
jgi:nitrous-oxide reductase